jgi:hypothetical protein
MAVVHPDLTAAIDNLFAVFARHPLAQPIGYCTHCVSDDEALVLQSTQLRALTAGELERFTFKAMSTWGDEADFRHFLPRILELFAADEQTYDYLFVKTIGNVRYHGTSWPAEELDAVERYLIALWRNTLARQQPPLRAPKILEAAAQNNHTVAAYLAILAEPPSESAILHLAELVDELTYSDLYDDAPRRESLAWLHSGVPTRILETALLSTDDPQAAARLGHALEQLEFFVNDSSNDIQQP